MSGILEITEERRRYLQNLSCGLETKYVSPERVKVKAVADRDIDVFYLKKSLTPVHEIQEYLHREWLKKQSKPKKTRGAKKKRFKKIKVVKPKTYGREYYERRICACGELAQVTYYPKTLLSPAHVYYRKTCKSCDRIKRKERYKPREYYFNNVK